MAISTLLQSKNGKLLKQNFEKVTSIVVVGLSNENKTKKRIIQVPRITVSTDAKKQETQVDWEQILLVGSSGCLMISIVDGLSIDGHSQSRTGQIQTHSDVVIKSFRDHGSFSRIIIFRMKRIRRV